MRAPVVKKIQLYSRTLLHNLQEVEAACRMAKTKRKRLAALGALKLTPSESLRSTLPHQDEHCPDKNSASLEVRQQRIVFWIPSDPSPRLVNPKSFRIGGTPSTEPQRSTNIKEKFTPSDHEEANIYPNNAKVILKLDKCTLEKGLSTPLALNTIHRSAKRAFQSREPCARVLTKDKLVFVLEVDTNCPGNPSVRRSKRTATEDKDELPPSSLSDDTIARELLAPQCSRRLKSRTRKIVSYNELVSTKSAHELRHEQDEAITKRKMLSNLPRKFAAVSEKEVDPPSERTLAQGVVSNTHKRQKTRLLVNTLSQHKQTLLRVESQVTALRVPWNERNLRSAEKSDVPESTSAIVVRGACTESASKGLIAPKKILWRVSGNTVVSGRATGRAPRNDVPAISNHFESSSYRKGDMTGDRLASTLKTVNYSGSSSVKAKLPKGPLTFLEKPNGQAPLCTSLLRTRKKDGTQAEGKFSVSTVLRATRMKVSSLTAVDDCKGLMVSELGNMHNATEFSNSVSGPEVLSLDESNKDHLMHHYHRSDVVTSSNNAIAFNSRSRRISFLRRNAGGYLEVEDPLRRAYFHRSPKPRQKFHSQKSTLTTRGSGVRGHGKVHRQLDIRDTPHAFQSYLNGSKANGHLVELIGQQGNVLRCSKPRHGCFDSRSLSRRASGYQRINHAVDMTAQVQSKLNEVGGLTEWLIAAGLGVFVDLFQERKLGEADLLHLTMGSLKEISGVKAVGPRRKLLWMIRRLL